MDESRTEGTPTSGALAYGAFFLSSAIWGSTFLFISIGNDALDPVWAASLRLGLAAAVLSVLAMASGGLPRGRALTFAALYGIFGFGINFPLLYIGELEVPSGITAVLFATIPLTTALFTRLHRLEPMQPRKLMGAVVGFLGVVLIFIGQIELDVPLRSLLMVLIGATSAAYSGVILKLGPRQASFGANAVGTAAAFPICLLLSIALGENQRIPTDLASAFPVAYLTLAGSVGAYGLFGWLVNHWPVTRISFITLVIPVIALVLGFVIRDETITSTGMAGSLAVLVGVLLGITSGRAR